MSTARWRLLVPLALASCAKEQHPQQVTTVRIPPVPVSAVPPSARVLPDAGVPAPARCVPAEEGCEWSPDCKRFFSAKGLPSGAGSGKNVFEDAFWLGFAMVCSCVKPPETDVTAELVVRELGKDWMSVTTECATAEHGPQPGTYTRESTSFAMPFLSQRPAKVRPLKEFFTPFIAASDNPSNRAFAIKLRDKTATLRGARWVHFADTPPGGAPPNVTSYLVGFTPAGYLAGFYTDGDRF